MPGRPGSRRTSCREARAKHQTVDILGAGPRRAAGALARRRARSGHVVDEENAAGAAGPARGKPRARCRRAARAASPLWRSVSRRFSSRSGSKGRPRQRASGRGQKVGRVRSARRRARPVAGTAATRVDAGGREALRHGRLGAARDSPRRET